MSLKRKDRFSILAKVLSILQGTATHLEQLEGESVDLVVTSPPYPMIEMWDEVFSAQNSEILTHLSNGCGREAFELMHRQEGHS